MQYTKSDAPVQKSIDTAGTETGNARRYRNNNAQVYLNPDGLPVAFRRVRSLQQPGSFASRPRLQLVTPRKTASISRTCFDAYKSKCAPLN
jgi:propanediol utilization protein